MPYYGEMELHLIEYLKSFLNTGRYDRMVEVLERRTEYLTIVLEDLHYSQNASSVIRHCDAFGIQSLSVIENRNRFKLKNHAVRGTMKWVHMRTFNELKHNSIHAIETLRSDGYRIVATSPRKGGTALGDFDLSKGKTALFFGNERDGLSDEILGNADEYLYIPMEGFVESLNISASCAIILQQMSNKLHSSDIPWALDDNKKNEILIEWMKGSIKKIDNIMAAYRNKSK